MSDHDERPAAGPSRQFVAVFVIITVLCVAVAVALSQQHRSGGDGGRLTNQTNPPSTSPQSSTDVGARDARAIALLARQQRALTSGSRAAYLATWDPRSSAQQQAVTTFDNLDRLRVTNLNARYVAADVGGLTDDEQRRLGGPAWTADVDIAWRLAGVDRANAHTTLTYTFVQRHGAVRVAAMAAASGSREPVWLLGPLQVRRSGRTLVAATTRAGAQRLDHALRQAVDDVEQVIPTWHGDLVAYVPSSAQQLDDVLAAAPGAYDGIAAVTTTVDGSRDPRAPVAIVINPPVFDRLGPIGSHVVVSHESTHVATDATTVTMPLWVAEGFADYVGVGSVDVPLSVSARSAVRDMRAHGVPTQLPDDGAFRGSGNLEAAYEEAWLAMRLIARDYGERRLVAFYEDVVHRPDAVATSLRANLGITEGALTRSWRTYLQELADGG